MRYLPLLTLLLASCIDDDYCADVHCDADQKCNPETAECECDPSTCGRYTCGVDDHCATSCYGDLQCVDPYVCGVESNQCEDLCKDGDCDGGFACDDFYNRCNTECWVDSDCRDGFTCCTDPFDCTGDRNQTCVR